MRNAIAQLSRCAAIFATLGLSLFLSAAAPAQTLKVLHDFDVAVGDGNIPYSGLTVDSVGNLYGTTLEGGANGFGTVYRLSPTGNGDYKETILYSFKGGLEDGANPHAPLFLDAQGNLYSTTVAGGINSSLCQSGVPASGCGIVFKLSASAKGEWTEAVLHRFTGPEGGSSFTGLVRDKAGNFYGATLLGGSKGMGAVFKLSHTSSGWKETVLHSFTGNPDGVGPFIDCATLAFDSKGNLYGSTYEGGTAGAGIVFELIPQASGAWTEKILHDFKGGDDGTEPFSGVIVDKNGDIYGSTLEGGTGRYGTVFKLAAAAGYAKAILHNFSLTDPAKGFLNALIFDGKGNLYGTTEYALFKLTPGSNGWSETVLWGWDGTEVQNGLSLFAPVTMDGKGNFFGTTTWGGSAGSTTGGVAFEIIP